METVIHSDNDFATVAFLRIKNATLERKSEAKSFDIHVPALLEEKFIAVGDAVLQSQNASPSNSSGQIFEPSNIADLADSFGLGISTKMLDSWVSVTNIQRYVADSEKDLSIEDEVRVCFQILQGTFPLPRSHSYLIHNRPSLPDRLSQHSLHLSNATNINIFLSSMDLFTRVNAIYATFFGTSPPARACVAVDLPPPIRVKLDCIAHAERTPNERQALHVQSLSYWAPANIGPYSQAITVLSMALFHLYMLTIRYLAGR